MKRPVNTPRWKWAITTDIGSDYPTVNPNLNHQADWKIPDPVLVVRSTPYTTGLREPWQTSIFPLFWPPLTSGPDLDYPTGPTWSTPSHPSSLSLSIQPRLGHLCGQLRSVSHLLVQITHCLCLDRSGWCDMLCLTFYCSGLNQGHIQCVLVVLNKSTLKQKYTPHIHGYGLKKIRHLYHVR